MKLTINWDGKGKKRARHVIRGRKQQHSFPVIFMFKCLSKPLDTTDS